MSDFGLACLFLALGSWIKPVNVPILIGAMPLLGLIFFGFRRKTLYAIGIVLATYLLMIFPVMLQQIGGDSSGHSANARLQEDVGRLFLAQLLHSLIGHGGVAFHDPAGDVLIAFPGGILTGVIRSRMARETYTYLDAHPEQYPNTRARNAYCQKKYLELIRKYPGAFFRTHLPQWTMLLPDLPTFLENNRLTTTGRGTLDIMRESGVYAALKHYLDGRMILTLPVLPFILVTGLLYLGSLMLLVVWLYHWKTQWRLLILFGIFAFFYLFAGGPVVMPRYQIPALPLLCAMAGTWFVLLCRKKRTAKT